MFEPQKGKIGKIKPYGLSCNLLHSLHNNPHSWTSLEKERERGEGERDGNLRSSEKN